MGVRNTKSAALVVDKTIERNLSLRTQIEVQRRILPQLTDTVDALGEVYFLRNTKGGFVVDAVLLIAPIKGSEVPMSLS